MPLKFLQKWPRTYGFDIAGKGPCYVIRVEKGSTAYRAGLQPGDQVLELDGRDVTTLSTRQIKMLAQAATIQPPELEVVSCLQTVIVKPDPLTGYGVKLLNEKPLRVEAVHYRGPAYHAGLRTGDIILEANGHHRVSIEALQKLLAQRPGKLTLLVIPVGRTANMVHIDKQMSKISGPDARLHKARELHSKLEILLGDDYASKVAVVNCLKRYAEDRDIVLMCQALNDVLNNKQYRRIIKQIRQLIPPAQRSTFDDMMATSPDNQSVNSTVSKTVSPTAAAHNLGQKKLIQIVRESGSFGFVIKSSSPAFIELIDPGGAAEKAGLMPGDYLIKLNGIDIRKFDHDSLVQLLQESGSAPTLEVLRCNKFGSVRSISTSSSTSSHNSIDNILYSNVILDKEGKSFTEKVDFLLTSKEAGILKRALRDYDTTRNIIELYDTVSVVLDTPSKKRLWAFIFVLLSTPHREYVSHRVILPNDILMEIVKSNGDHSSRSTNEEQMMDIPELKNLPPSYQQQLDFLLTSAERQQFNSCLSEYGRELDLASLIKTLETILDTPSKRILWRVVLPHLTHGHREVVRARLNLPGRHTGTSSRDLSTMDSYIGPQYQGGDNASGKRNRDTESNVIIGNSAFAHEGDDHLSSSWEENDSTDESYNSPRGYKLSNIASTSGHDPDLRKELEETKKAVQEVRDALRFHETNNEDTIAAAGPSEEDLAYLDAQRFVTIIPVGFRGLERREQPFYNREVDSRHLHDLRTGMVASKNQGGGGTTNWNLPSLPRLHVHHGNHVSSTLGNYTERENRGVYGNPLSNTPDLSSSYNQSALSALQQLDAATAEEPSDADTSPRTSEKHHETQTEAVVRVEKANNETKNAYDKKEKSEAPNFIPPPPPLPPPLPEANHGADSSPSRMQVKRINWDKLDNQSVENTIWEKIHENDLSEVIHFLELETQFSTKSSRQKEGEKKKEILIMSQKKAYNISILLGHLKMPLDEVKQALYSMDASSLSPELIQQLLTYAPNQHEIAQYKLYNGDKSLLTQPDQFAYKMSFIGDYEDRLKALLFKSSFREKINEVRQNLEHIKAGSLELKNSQKLARLLEVILAMGNYMNKGNSRVGEAAGFRITFLTQLDVTKTADKKSSFLHVLAEAAYGKFPELLSLSDELSTVNKAAKVSIEVLNQDVHNLKTDLEDTSTLLARIGGHSHPEPGDRFQDVMGHFLAEATDEIQSVFRLQASAMTAFSETVQYFGEDPKTFTTDDVFEIFSTFIRNFERAHRHNVMFKRQ